jgi:exosortase C (VPDSG-CTERM-specific)
MSNKEPTVLHRNLTASPADPHGAASAPPPLAHSVWPGVFRTRGKALAVWALVLVIGFGKPLFDLTRYAVHSSLYSHIVLIPFISLYLLRLQRRNLALDSQPARGLAAFPLLAGLATLAAYWLAVRSGWKPKTEDYLALMTVSFLSFLAGGACLFLGSKTLRVVAFPAAFLVFMVPFPTVVRDGIENFFQRGSAEAAHALFTLSGMPVFRQGMSFQLPGFSLQVAAECSGIHSSLVLFITSLLAGYLLLNSPWKQAVLTLAVVPLAFMRNGIRIVTIGQLCVRVSPDMINSYIHRHGGPIFFVLSLIPFFLLLVFLRRLGSSRTKPGANVLSQLKES